jgi:ribulose kinase
VCAPPPRVCVQGFYEEMNRDAAAIPPGCEGLVTLDHFQGNRTPFTDPLRYAHVDESTPTAPHRL